MMDNPTRRSALIGLAATTLMIPACQSSDGKRDADVIIMGAGLSGLYAAMLLEDVGLDVIVVEALPRVGGRMHTLDHGDGYTEGGGQQISASYARVLDVATQLNVPLYTETGPGPEENSRPHTAPVMAEAINSLPYTQIMQVHMRALSSYWDTDDRAPNLWTDTNLERVFSDSGRDGSLTGFQQGWVNGGGVAAWMSDPDTAVARYVDRLGNIRPAAKGQVDPVALIDWTDANPYAGGAYYHWQPGQADRLARKMGLPIGPLRFAGEHLGLLHTGMEAAMESSERATIDIIERVL